MTLQSHCHQYFSEPSDILLNVTLQSHCHQYFSKPSDILHGSAHGPAGPPDGVRPVLRLSPEDHPPGGDVPGRVPLPRAVRAAPRRMCRLHGCTVRRQAGTCGSMLVPCVPVVADGYNSRI